MQGIGGSLIARPHHDRERFRRVKEILQGDGTRAVFGVVGGLPEAAQGSNFGQVFRGWR